MARPRLARTPETQARRFALGVTERAVVLQLGQRKRQGWTGTVDEFAEILDIPSDRVWKAIAGLSARGFVVATSADEGAVFMKLTQNLGSTAWGQALHAV